MCQKRQRRCPALLEIREEAFGEWCRAETFDADGRWEIAEGDLRRLRAVG